ncbi:S9 family peptidase [Kangiella sp. HZ709]|uniref:S9 family peptidase n=1 Tax=Kangiella sp. HZ709 TaxID=2666328 RepID=UPI0012B0EAEF|nr:S9 family peptidase [Kangiella sp. HZ709]MRX27396.1 prolyl oligopeptidase family serine peptidase [Kangiella sp. HZ709]
MKKIITTILIGALGMASTTVAQAKELSVERIYSDPSLDGPAPRSVKLSPDGSRVTFLKGKEDEQERLDLWEYNLKDKKSRMLVDSRDLLPGEENLSDEEKARRERMRLFAKGIISYYWGDDGKTLLFPLGGDIFAYDITKAGNGATKQLTKTETYETDIKLSPNGDYVSFIRDQNIFMVNVKTGKETQLTFDGEGTIKNGMAEFVAQEEMGRLTGYWWSPDSKKVAYLQVDESPVNIEKRYEINAEDFTVFEQRYPSTGTNNVTIKLGVLNLDSNKTTWIDTGKKTDIYIPRVKWLKDSKSVSYQWQSRDQKTLELRFADIANGSFKKVLTEAADTWINLTKDLRFLKKSKQFIWTSERDGFRHIYLYDLEGKLIKQLTQGDWVVDNVYGVDEKNGLVYFDANKESPLEQHLYSVPLAGGELKKITQQSGVHGVTFAKSMDVFVDYFSSTTQPSQVSLRKANGDLVTWLEQNKLDKTHPYYDYYKKASKPEFGTIKAEDGQEMQYRIYKPVPFNANKKYPVIVDVYGGPHAQRVRNTWGARNTYWHHLMASKGFVVFSLDNRGSWNRGKKFEDPIYRKLGNIELVDQVKGVEYLTSLPYVDKDKIGMFGWSYGGYMTIMAMFKNPEIFKVGVSVAPVTDWYLYDTHYTERYLDHPKNNKEGYEASNVFPYLEGLQGNLMVIHGMADDNVLFTNSTKLYKALQDANKPFDQMNYPGSKHSIWGKKTRTHVFNTITDYFEKHLK